MVLLDILRQKPDLKLIVAHFNHGIRPDSTKDEELVVDTARKYSLPVEVGFGNLGPDASEEQSRKARYRFLESVRRKHRAKTIITAHHQDDLIETALLNILRGTGRRGLVAMSLNRKVVRPLLYTPKQKVKEYAKKNKISWHEDPTNRELSYLRNYLRKMVMPGLDQKTKQEIVNNIDKVAKIEPEAQKIIATISRNIMVEGEINRRLFLQLPDDVAKELVLYWLRAQGLKRIDRKAVNRLKLAIKNAQAFTHHDVQGAVRLEVEKETAHFSNRG